MERFLPELEADLEETYGVDLAELFESKRWPKLLRLIDNLPPHSRFISAIRSDEEEARRIVSHPDFGKETAKDTGPPLVGYTQINYQLADITDALKALQATLIGVNGGKAKNPRPVKRPMTAIDKVKAEKDKAVAVKTMDLFSPKTE